MKFLVLSFVLLLLACHPLAHTSLTRPSVNYAQFIELEAIDLCQDMGPSPTMHDEIILYAHLLEVEDRKSWKVLQTSYHGPFFFRRGDKVLLNATPLNLQTVKSAEQAFLVLTLLELDGEKDTYSLQKRQAIISKELLKGRFFKDDKEKYRLSPWLNADEVLDVLSFKLLELKKKPEWSLRFHGIDLFDQYDYRMAAKLY